MHGQAASVNRVHARSWIRSESPPALLRSWIRSESPPALLRSWIRSESPPALLRTKLRASVESSNHVWAAIVALDSMGALD